jgi:CBS domain-containing protein
MRGGWALAQTEGRPSPDTLNLIRGWLAWLPATDVVGNLADHYDDVTRRALAQAEAQLGPPPVGYTWLALGSHARREPSLASDQDNALVLADDSPDARTYGTELAKRVVHALEEAGLRRCTGDYMATSWAYSLAEWQTVLRHRLMDSGPKDIVDIDVFLDLRGVAGGVDITPLQEILVGAAGSARLLHWVARAAVAYDIALTPFGRLRGTHGHIDLKRSGLAPLTMLARTYSLAAGSTAVETGDRLAAAEAADQLSHQAAERLASAHRVLTRLRLMQQLRCARDGQPITDRVALAALSRVDLRELRQSLAVIRSLQRSTAVRFRTDLSS